MMIGECIATHSNIGISYPKGVYRCLILDSDFETATFQEAKNKRLINALKYVFAKAPLLAACTATTHLGDNCTPPRHPISGLRRRYAFAKLHHLSIKIKMALDF